MSKTSSAEKKRPTSIKDEADQILAQHGTSYADIIIAAAAAVCDIKISRDDWQRIEAECRASMQEKLLHRAWDRAGTVFCYGIRMTQEEALAMEAIMVSLGTEGMESYPLRVAKARLIYEFAKAHYDKYLASKEKR
jgi:hypothetical protein